VGKKVTEDDLSRWEQHKGIIFTEEQRKAYLSIGGLSRLDLIIQFLVKSQKAWM